jgi:hypothetical protein
MERAAEGTVFDIQDLAVTDGAGLRRSSSSRAVRCAASGARTLRGRSAGANS